VFAPLADEYRKAGLLDEAIDIAREGVSLHPSYMGGKVALARALFEKNRYEEVVDILIEVVKRVPDNIVAQKLLGDSYLMLENRAEALNAYQMLAFFQPNDEETERLIRELSESTQEVPQSVRKIDSEIRESPKRQSQINQLYELLQRVEIYRTNQI